MSPSPAQLKEAHKRRALAYQMGINGDSIDAIQDATGWSRNYVHTFLAEQAASYPGVRAKPGRPAIPPALAPEYRTLVFDQGWPSKEAARILGLMP